MLVMLVAAAAMMAQAPWTLPPPRLETDTTVTYMAKPAPPAPTRQPAPQWHRRAPAPATPAAPAVPVHATGTNAFGLHQGDILIETGRHRLIYAVSADQVETFPVAVGKMGASWKGTAVVGRKVVFPTWRPTSHMRGKDRSLPSVVPPGRHNPLGTRALYLYRNGRDTLFRIHGTNAPWSIGKSVSHGCIRMLNANVEHLYNEVRLGAVVTVR